METKIVERAERRKIAISDDFYGDEPKIHLTYIPEGALRDPKMPEIITRPGTIENIQREGVVLFSRGK